MLQALTKIELVVEEKKIKVYKLWYIIKKNGVYCKCVLFGCVYILHV